MRRTGILALAGMLAVALAWTTLGEFPEAAPWRPAQAQKPPPAAAPPTGALTKPAPLPGKPAAEAPPADAVPLPDQSPSPRPNLPQTPGGLPPVSPRATLPADEPTAIGRLRRLLGPDTTLAYSRAEVTDPARGTVRLAGVVISGTGRVLRIETLTLDDLRDDGLGEAEARNLSIEQGNNDRITIERARLTGLTVRRPAVGQPQTADLMTLDSLRVEGLTMRDSLGNGVQLAQAVLEDYGPGRQTHVVLDGLVVRLPPSSEAVERVTLRRATLRGVDIATVVTALSQDQAPPTAGRLALEIEEVAATGPQNRVVGSMASLRLISDQPAVGIGTGSFALRALRLQPFGGMTSWMQRLGYAVLLFDLTADSRYDPASGRIDLTSMSLVGQDIGTLSLTYSGDGATAAAMHSGDFTGVRLIAAGLRYIDQGLVGRLLGQQARDSNTPEPQLREQYANMAAGALAAPALTAVREAVQRFIRGQAREVEITLQPQQPVALQELQQRPPTTPAEAATRLGLGAVAR